MAEYDDKPEGLKTSRWFQHMFLGHLWRVYCFINKTGTISRKHSFLSQKKSFHYIQHGKLKQWPIHNELVLHIPSLGNQINRFQFQVIIHHCLLQSLHSQEMKISASQIVRSSLKILRKLYNRIRFAENWEDSTIIATHLV